MAADDAQKIIRRLRHGEDIFSIADAFGVTPDQVAATLRDPVGSPALPAPSAGGGGGGGGGSFDPDVDPGNTGNGPEVHLETMTLNTGDPLLRMGYHDRARLIFVHGKCSPAADATNGAITFYCEVIPPLSLHQGDPNWGDNTDDWGMAVAYAQNGWDPVNQVPLEWPFGLTFMVPAGWDYAFNAVGTDGFSANLNNLFQTLL